MSCADTCYDSAYIMVSVTDSYLISDIIGDVFICNVLH